MGTIMAVFHMITWRDFYWLMARILLSFILESQVFAAEPSFRVPEINVTAIKGETAILPCSIQFLGDHKVVWTDDQSFLLTLADRRIIDDDRMSVERPFTKDWNLHIRDVRYSDQGRYICQINTDPVKTKHVQLIVLVPPEIYEETSSADMIVREGDTVTLVCNASGVPAPSVSWFRIGTQPFQDKEKIGSTGEVLIIHNVSRDCGGKYECEADNGLGSIAKRQMYIDVQYPPEVSMPARRMGQYPGKETFLQCEVNAHPHGIMYWSKDGVDLDIGLQTAKYTVEMYSGDDQEKKILSLRIRAIRGIDYGQYTCIAKNFLGEDSETMLLYDYSLHHSTTARPTTENRRLDLQTPVTNIILNKPKNNYYNGNVNIITRPGGSNGRTLNRGQNPYAGDPGAVKGNTANDRKSCVIYYSLLIIVLQKLYSIIKPL